MLCVVKTNEFNHGGHGELGAAFGRNQSNGGVSDAACAPVRGVAC